ncbi:Glucan endo-1,3-beta-glucosidase 11 [Linum grandiflorum]
MDTTFINFIFLFSIIVGSATSLGINYGQIGNNLPQPSTAVELLTSLRITKARIYDTNPQILTAFANSQIDLIVTVENQMLSTLMDPQQALQWVTAHVKPYVRSTRITGIAVGNEVFTDDDDTLLTYLVPGIDRNIEVSTPHSLAVLETSYPPSAGEFNYVLFNPNPGMVDPSTGLHYDNMLYAQVDAVVFAISKLGYGNIEVRVSETGWPSNGDADEVGATVQNAASYNRNLLRRQVYLFALFNEDMKPGPTSERNYGLYQPDCSMVYNVGLASGRLGGTNNAAATASSVSTSGGGASPHSFFFLSSSATKVR